MRRRDQHREEAGAIVPMAALLMTVVLAITAFAVDLGLQRAAARDMQAVADAVALDTARVLPTCNNSTLRSAANKSLSRQGHTIGADAPLSVVAGHLNPTTHQFIAGSNGSGVCNAVKVFASTTVDFAFAPVIGTDSGTATRSAVGSTDEPAVCFSAGTTTLTLSTNGSALSPILDNILKTNLGVGGYSGLVDLKNLAVPLADLNAALTAGTGQSLVDVPTVSLANFMLATATVLSRNGNTAQAVVLQSIAAQVSGLTVDVADFLSLGTAGASALGASVNALDLMGTAIVSAAIEAGNGKNALNISSLGLSVGPVNLADAKITIIEPPQIACGKVGVQAKTAQVRVDLQTGLSTGGLGISAAHLSLGIRVASGTATLSALSCSASNPSASIVGETSVASVTGYGGTGSARLTVLQLWPLPALHLGLQGGVGQSTSEQSFMFPPNSDGSSPGMRTYGSAVNLKLSITPDSLLGLGGLLGLVINPLLSLANSIIEPLLDPLLGLLGIRLGTMDVTMLGRPSCSGVRLVG